MEKKNSNTWKRLLLAVGIAGMLVLAAVMFVSYHILKDFDKATPLSKESVESIIGTQLPPSARDLVGELEGFQDNFYRARWDMSESDVESLVASTAGKVLEPVETPQKRSEHDPDWWNPGLGVPVGETRWKEGPPDFYVYLYFERQDDVCRVYLSAHDT